MLCGTRWPLSPGEPQKSGLWCGDLAAPFSSGGFHEGKGLMEVVVPEGHIVPEARMHFKVTSTKQVSNAPSPLLPPVPFPTSSQDPCG